MYLYLCLQSEGMRGGTAVFVCRGIEVIASKSVDCERYYEAGEMSTWKGDISQDGRKPDMETNGYIPFPVTKDPVALAGE